jgi:hypothetical protein
VSWLVALALVTGIAAPVAAGTRLASVTPLIAESGTMPGPSGLSTVQPFIGYRISCGTPKSCFVVGTNLNSAGNTVPFALAWEGAKWKSVAIHAPKGTRFDAMRGVSCQSATFCLAIGSDVGSGREQPFALIWNGSVVRSAPLPPRPSGVDTLLTDVACVAVNSCVVAGRSAGNSGAAELIVETWNGSKWILHAMAEGKGISFATPWGVSCVSLSHCMLAGDEVGPSTGMSRPYIAVWNGKTATTMKVPVPSGAKSPAMLGVSCISASDCAAIGADLRFGSTFATIAFTESWNGKAWTTHRFAWPAADPISLFGGISCTHSAADGTRCIAVGAAGTQNHGTPVAVSWNGKEWSVLKVHTIGIGTSAALEDINCLSTKECTAIGRVGPPGSIIGAPLAGFWNGSVWRITAA